MTYVAFLAAGLFSGLLLSWLFGRFKPEDEVVCILDCVDGTTFRAVCIDGQETQCQNVLRKKCDPDFEPEDDR